MSQKTFDKCGEAKKFTFVAHVFVSLVIALPLMGTVPSAIVQEEGSRKVIQSIWEVWEKEDANTWILLSFPFRSRTVIFIVLVTFILFRMKVLMISQVRFVKCRLHAYREFQVALRRSVRKSPRACIWPVASKNRL